MSKNVKICIFLKVGNKTIAKTISMPYEKTLKKLVFLLNLRTREESNIWRSGYRLLRNGSHTIFENICSRVGRSAYKKWIWCCC